MNTKRTWSTAVLALLMVGSPFAQSAPLQKTQVAEGAKWVVHLDWERFRETQVGGFLKTNVIAKALEDSKESMPIDVNALLDKVISVTAYGTDYKTQPANDGVLILKTDAKGQEIVEGLLAAQLLANTNGPIKQLQTKPYPLYSMQDQVFGSIQPSHTILLSKSREQLDRAREVLAGKAPNLSRDRSFSEFTKGPEGYFFLGVAEGFNENAAMPPQAKVLQMADGGRIMLGEREEKLWLELGLKAKTKEVVTQIQQVVQGMVALFSLGQPENKELSELVAGVKVSTKDHLVFVGVDYPVAKALAKLNEELEAKSKATSSKPAKKKKKKGPPTPEEDPQSPPQEKPEPSPAQ